MKYKVIKLNNHNYIVVRELKDETEGYSCSLGQVFWWDTRSHFSRNIKHFFSEKHAIRVAKRLYADKIEQGKTIWEGKEL